MSRKTFRQYSTPSLHTSDIQKFLILINSLIIILVDLINNLWYIYVDLFIKFTLRRSIMKATGIIRKVDELGRIVIPIELRNKLDIAIKDPIEIFVEGSSIILKKYEPNCIFCGNSKDLTSYKDKLVCSKCLTKLSDLSK